jgi:hypothetical protein
MSDTDPNTDPEATDPAAPKTVAMSVLVKTRKDLQRRAEKAEREAKEANARYEAAMQTVTDLKTEHAEALAAQQHDFEASRVFDSIGASAPAEGDDPHADARAWLKSKYASIEASVPEGAPEGTEPSKPSFAEWVPQFVATSPTMVAYRKSDDAPKPKVSTQQKHGAVKRVAFDPATDPSQRQARDTGSQAEAPVSEAAFVSMDPAQQRAALESMNLIDPKQPDA